MFLPENISNSSKIRIISGSVSEYLPVSIEPLSEKAEFELISCMMQEIAENYAIEIDRQPVLNRCSGDTVFENDCCDSRIFVIGASHSTRLVGGLAKNGLNVINLAKGGWKLTDESAAEISQKLKQYAAGKDDTILIDPLSNGIFCGTDTDGNFLDPVFSDGIWHIPGNLCIRPKPYVKTLLSKCKKITDLVPESRLIFLVPIPRYITAPCCSNADHVTNLPEQDFAGEISGDMERIEETLDAFAQSCGNPSLVLSYRAVADDPDAPLPELAVNSHRVWQFEDLVHAEPALYSALVTAVISGVDELGGELPQAAPKRMRHESVGVRSRGFVAGDPVRKPVRKQSWSSGVLPDRTIKPPQRGNSRGWPRLTHGWRGGRGAPPHYSGK